MWEPATAGRCCWSRGGSGIVPLMAMLRHRAATGDAAPVRLLYSSRTLEDVIYPAELDGCAGRTASR